MCERRMTPPFTIQVQKKHYDSIGKRIVTVIQPAGQWWDAEDYHQVCCTPPTYATGNSSAHFYSSISSRIQTATNAPPIGYIGDLP